MKLFGDKSFGKTEQIEQNQDQECSGVERVGYSVTRVFRKAFWKKTVEQRLEGDKGLAMHGERGTGCVEVSMQKCA